MTKTPNKIKLTDPMVLWATRYCLGRMTYAVMDCVDYLCAHWNDLGNDIKCVIVRDIKEAIAGKNCGMECDKRQWQRVLNLKPPKEQHYASQNTKEKKEEAL